MQSIYSLKLNVIDVLTEKQIRLPHPDGDFEKFFKEIKRLSLNSPRIFCTVRKAEHTWIDFDKLKKSYGPPSSSACTIS